MKTNRQVVWDRETTGAEIAATERDLIAEIEMLEKKVERLQVWVRALYEYQKQPYEKYNKELLELLKDEGLMLWMLKDK